MAMTPGSASDWIASGTVDTLSGSVTAHARPSGSANLSGPVGLSEPFLEFPAALAAFASAWERDETRVVDEFVLRLDPCDSNSAVELIYREFCLAEAAGAQPDPAEYGVRFPRHKAALERLLSLHAECTASLLSRWVDCVPSEPALPEAGDEIGPYFLRRELGRGSFARVYLAEQTDLENRLVVLKVSTRMSREPWLLARVRHPHIVEIVSHAPVNDGAMHVIAMPFWGGATLAAVLGVARQRAAAPTSGRDLLAGLDAVAAAEFPTVHPARPAREILTKLSYSQSIAWVGARLAEALDHAFGRAVAHGDIKPSNILLAADGNPMLLDFNLARDGAPTGPTQAAADLGGTLAYMAPERLKALAADNELAYPWGSSLAESAVDTTANGRRSFDHEATGKSAALVPDDRTDQIDARTSSGAELGPHLADIYALGMVLLESLTGAAPPQPAVDTTSPCSSTHALLATARGFAAARSSTARAVIRAAEITGGRPVARGLRAILERALSPAPSERYQRAWELAEDLDRWRSDRPLAFTNEPFWGLTVPRWLRRQRRVLVTAALALAVAGLTATVSMIRSEQALRAIALANFARHIDDPETYRFQRSTKDWLGDRRQVLMAFQPSRSDDSKTVDSLLRALNDYGVLGPGNWRERPDVRLLPAADRVDLELWLAEQAFRYCRALEDRPSSPADWQRALDILNRVAGERSIEAFVILGRRLLAKLDAGGQRAHAVAKPVSSCSPAPGWLDAYLLGVATECDSDDAATPRPNPAASVAQPSRDTLDSTGDWLTQARRKTALRALEYYGKLLVLRPESYWGHYRIAAVSYSLGRFAETARHLEKCLERRPGNAALRGQRAACLAWLELFPEALDECNRALDGAPDLAELFRTRAFIRAASGQSGGLGDDIQHFEVLSRRLPPSFWGTRSLASGHALAPITWPAMGFRGASPPRQEDREQAPQFTLPDDDLSVEPEDLTARAVLAQTILRAGEPEIALLELGKILMLDQNHFAARMTRAQVSIRTRRFDDATRDFDVILGHPGLLAYCREDPTYILRFHDATRAFIEHGRPDQAEALARRTLESVAVGANPPLSRLPQTLLEIDARQFDLARRHIDSVLGNPSLTAALRKNPALFSQLDEVTHSLLRQGRSAEGQTVARRILDQAIKLSQHRAPAHYNLARAYAACGPTDPASIVEAADQLFHASYSAPEYMQNYERDPIFDRFRAQLAAMLAQMAQIHQLPNPTDEYRRRFSPYGAEDWPAQGQKGHKSD
jgi:serine/threonine protein kinase